MSEIDKTKIKSVDPLMQLILLDISNLRTHFAELKELAPELFGTSTSEAPICDHWEFWITDEILDYIKGDITDLLGDKYKGERQYILKII